MGSVDEEVRMGGAITDDALILLDWTKKQNYGVVSEGKSLTSLPAGEERVFVDFVLRLGKNANNGVAPGWVGTMSVGHDDRAGFAGELMKFII